MSKYVKAFSAFLVLGLSSACTSSKSVAAAKSGSYEKVEVVALEETTQSLSDQIYLGKLHAEGACVRCHPMPPLTNYTAEEWTPILKRMQPKAKLSDAEMLDLQAYIFSKL